MLTVDRLCAGYGGGIVLHEVSLRVRPGSIQAVVGRNGAGKSTLVHTIAGLVRASSGRIEIGGVHVAGRQPHRIAQSGVGLVPQGRRVFSRLTVAEQSCGPAQPVPVVLIPPAWMATLAANTFCELRVLVPLTRSSALPVRPSANVMATPSLPACWVMTSVSTRTA